MQSPMKTVLRILSLSSEVHTCTHGSVHRDSWTHFAIWKSCKCSTWAPQSFCNSTDKSQHPAASKEPHELCQGRLFSLSLSTVCISHRQACYFVKTAFKLSSPGQQITTNYYRRQRQFKWQLCFLIPSLKEKKSFWQACLLKDYIGTVRASDTAQRSGVHSTQLLFQGNPAALHSQPVLQPGTQNPTVQSGSKQAGSDHFKNILLQLDSLPIFVYTPSCQWRCWKEWTSREKGFF